MSHMASIPTSRLFSLRRAGQAGLPVVLTVALTGCSWLGLTSNANKYLEAESIPASSIPGHLDRPDFVVLMEIPEVQDSRGIAGQEFELELPEPMSSAGVDQVVIKKLGDEHWLFVDAPPAIVWPKIMAWCEANHVPVIAANPRRGLIETSWIISADGDAKQVVSSITDGGSWADPNASVRNRFLIRLEPGIRPQSTELHIRHQGVPLAEFNAVRDAAWYAPSDNLPVEHEFLQSMAFELGETINETVVFSRMAAELRGERAQVLPDRERPVLNYQLDFDRAWATVNSALRSARITVEDVDRSSQILYVYYDETLIETPGFIRRLFGAGKKVDEKRYQLHLETVGEEVHVTVHQGQQQLAEAATAERLLKIIKQFSS